MINFTFVDGGISLRARSKNTIVGLLYVYIYIYFFKLKSNMRFSLVFERN